MPVYLVGAGPGDADLLTLRAARLLARADVVVYDRLVGADVLDMIAPWAERIDVGKDPYGVTIPQSEINQILVEQGLSDRLVVRLKGGDPYVFGRGGEEALALGAVGIESEVVPGITSAIAGPAAAGIPVTHRGVSSGFTVITGFQDPNTSQRLDWNAAAKLGTTLVILMGASRAAQIRDRLLDGGAPSETPVAVVTRATMPDQSVARGSLSELGDQPIENPSIIVVGPAASLDLAAVHDSASLHDTNLSLQGVLPWQ
jgi:uroporphyrin-III C-methyltransferase